MTEKLTRGDYLHEHGAALIENGYKIVPIKPGKKAPGFDGWEKSKSTKAQLREWLEDGFRNAGVGVLTKETCAIDIDCRDEEAALKFEAMALELLGPAPVRIGNPPKRLLLYRTSEPFRKMRTTKYADEWGDAQQIEILGDGQQFVAFHIHPDTLKPYEWVDGKSPLTIRASDLTELDVEKLSELMQAFEDHAKGQGWTLLKAKRQSAKPIDLSNPWVEDSAPVDISNDELHDRLMLIPGSDDYDTWFQVGMALYHQFDGDDEGFRLWDEWSETADNYDHDALERHWKSFGIEGKKRAPLTARFILRLAKEAVEHTAVETANKLRDAFLAAKDIAEWEKARKLAQEAEIDSLGRSALAQVAKDRRDAITGTKTPLVEIKRAIAYKPKHQENAPKWIEDWVYDVSDDKFYHVERKIATSKQGFDAMYDRKALTKKDILDGKQSPSQSASSLALNLWHTPIVEGRRYMPGKDSVFTEPDGTFANTYADRELPELPEKLLPRDKKNIERVKNHISHLLASEDEQRMLLDWLSWVVQNPGRHVNYAVLVQGVQGDGKSFFAEMLRAVMGVSNVTMLNAHIVHSDFTDWAAGQCVACLEEVRIVGGRGKDKWETVNRIKPFITNNIIEIHPKGKPVTNVTNTTSYLLFSNYKDALPLDENDRRYLILFSRWQHKELIREFKRENPSYYQNLYNTLVESAGALRKWLLDHEQSEGFDPFGDAPDTQAKKLMVAKSKPEFIQAIDEMVIEDDVLEACRDFVDITGLAEVMMARGIEMPGNKALTSMMERDGYEYLGKVYLGETLGRHTFYTKNYERYVKNIGNQVIVDSSVLSRDYKARMSALDDEL